MLKLLNWYVLVKTETAEPEHKGLFVYTNTQTSWVVINVCDNDLGLSIGDVVYFHKLGGIDVTSKQPELFKDNTLLKIEDLIAYEKNND